MVEESSVIKLNDGNEYIVTHKVNYLGKEYCFLVDVVDNSNIKFCYFDDTELVEVEDPAIITELLPLFAERARQILPKEVLDQLEDKGA